MTKGLVFVFLAKISLQHLSRLMLKHLFLSVLWVAFALSARAQSAPVFSGKPVQIPENTNLSQTLRAYQVFDIASSALLAHLREESNGEKIFHLNLPGAGEWPLALVSSGLIPEAYRLRVDDGQKITELPGPGDIAWKGRVVGSAQSDVRLTVADGFIFGSIQRGSDIWFIEPLSDLLPGAAADRYILYRTADVLPNPHLKCGVTEAQEKKARENRAKKQPEKPENMVGLCKNVDLAIASAYDMFERYSTVAQVETHNIGVMNSVGTDYDDPFDDDIYFVIATQYVSTTTSSSLDVALTSSTDANVLLNNFTAWGNAGNFGVTFDDGQLWTARNICDPIVGCGVIGLAWIGTVCGNSRYHLLEDYTGSNPNGTGWQLRVLTSHELGHNFDCEHDPAGSGTIMSPSVNNTTTWSATSIADLNTFLGGISCLAVCGANFDATAYTVSEFASGTYLPAGAPSCEMPYSEISIPVTYSGSAAGGSVSVSVTGGTAVQDLDFDIPNPTVTFPAGSTNQTGSVTLRVWNDAISETNETINLELGGTLVGSQNTATVTIVSDDLDPATSYSTSGQIGSGNAGNLSAPFRGSVTDCRTQFIFNATELITAGFSANDAINGLALEITAKNSTQPYSGFTIKMKHTTSAANSTGQPENTGFTTVYSSSHTTAVGWNRFNFTNAFTWNGTNNVRVEICFDNASGSSNDLVSSMSGAATVFITGTASGCSLPTSSWSFFGSNRPNARLYKGTDIAITLNDEANTNLKAGQTAYFKDAQNEFIMTVKENSGTDVGCVNVQIDRAGNGRQSLPWAPGFFVSNKTFFVTADNPNTSYDLTLYFSEAEMAGWPTPSTLNILKSATSIATSSTSNSSINTAVTRAFFGPTSNPDAYYSYKGTFTGFSGFAITDASSVPLPIEWLDFTGKWLGKTVALHWATAAERDNRGFDVERSDNGISFEKIGFVPGRGTISVPQPYTFDDPQAAQTRAAVRYYRLRQVDADGSSSHSNTLPMLLPGNSAHYLLYPNPARHSVTLQMLRCDDCAATVTLSDAAGREVLRTETSAAATPLDLSGLPSGVYWLDVRDAEGSRWQTKLVRM
jgi:hypothetical protein